MATPEKADMTEMKRKERGKKIVEDAFHVSKGVLIATTDMYWEYLEEFESACARLLEARVSRLEVDLSAVNFISSSFVGCLGNLLLQASRLKKRVVLKVTLDVSWLFDIMGGPKILDMEVV